MIRLILKSGREESILRRHPWLFSGAVARADGDGSDGIAEVVDAGGRSLAYGAYSPDSQIVARLWTFDGRLPDAGLFAERFAAARRLRQETIGESTTGFRAVHSEGDRCSGVVLDVYGDTAVLDLLTEGTELWAEGLETAAREAFAPREVLVKRSGSERDRARSRPSPQPSPGGRGGSVSAQWAPSPHPSPGGGGGSVSAQSAPSPHPSPGGGGGSVSAQSAPSPRPSPGGRGSTDERRVPFLENGLRFFADVTSGQKTGFFLDQRENRSRVRALANGKSVLNLFSYSGAFSVAALAGGAQRAVDVDTSAPALDLAREHRRANGFGADHGDFVEADVFEDVRRRVAAGERWDMVVCDPPAFAKKRADVDRAARGYKDVNRVAMALVAPGGWLLTCSCSGLVDADLFQKIVFSASLDAGIPFALVARQGAGTDHPVSLDCPEGEYLKGLWLRRA